MQAQTEFPRRYERTSPRKQCSCGVMLYTPNNRQHLKGTQHRYGKRLAQLLNTPCITLDEIGKRLGITRERVRQLALKHNIKGLERQKTCTLNKKRIRWFERFKGSQLERFKLACEAKGLTCEFVPNSSTFSNNQLMVNGKWVVVKTLRNYPATYPYVGIVQTLIPCDYVAYDLRDGRWLILPHSMARSTTFVLHEVAAGSPGCTHSFTHGWYAYVENWGQLK